VKPEEATDSDEEDCEGTAIDFSEFAQTTPLRLTSDERAKLFLTKGALIVSDYTDKVDIMPGRYGGTSRSKMTRILSQLEDVLSTLLGLLVTSNFREGNKLVAERRLCDNSQFFQQVFEVARRKTHVCCRQIGFDTLRRRLFSQRCVYKFLRKAHTAYPTQLPSLSSGFSKSAHTAYPTQPPPSHTPHLHVGPGRAPGANPAPSRVSLRVTKLVGVMRKVIGAFVRL
jgi:hypothetical protein